MGLWGRGTTALRESCLGAIGGQARMPVTLVTHGLLLGNDIEITEQLRFLVLERSAVYKEHSSPDLRGSWHLPPERLLLPSTAPPRTEASPRLTWTASGHELCSTRTMEFCPTQELLME